MNKEIYNKIRERMPDKIKVGMSKAAFRVMNKPIYDGMGKRNYEKGRVIISADFEMTWAWRYAKRKVNAKEKGMIERENFPLILRKLNELEIPITWGTVGHLFLSECKCKNGKAHSEMPRPKYFENEYWKYDKGDWYDIDTCSNYKTNPEIYAPDLIEMILNSKVKHEIACHSFSHCDFSEKNSYPELIEAELDASEQAMRKFGVKPETFIFPANQYGNFDLLKKFGYTTIRFKSNEMKEIGYPEILTNELVAIHDSIAIDIPEEGWHTNYIVNKLKKYVDKAIAKNAICHFWFHPSVSKECINDVMFPLFDYINKRRESSDILTLTMNEIKNFS